MEHDTTLALKRKLSSTDSHAAGCKLLKLETNINSLPDDILFEIFKYIPCLELYFSIALVSRRWRNISLHPSFWRRIELRNTKQCAEGICQLLRSVSFRVNELYIYDRSDCDVILDQASKHNKNISVLSLSHCGGKTGNRFISSKIIKSVITRLPKLRALRLYDTTFRSVKFFEIFGSQKFMLSRSRKLGKKNNIKNQPITYTGILTYKQLEAYTRNLNTSGKVTLNNGKEYTIRRVREILHSNGFDPNSIVRTLEDNPSVF
ncbi:uncharacterized protein LOC119658936 isoform X2 [Hermetia illucens]|uniref:uncharacterized protein LOC119658936 isoform X2 n=1 Tax=Hermetia illucens TaxID=343691 RepID=UPI0018CC2988|nr:uncharacterized protein LOC119658936 isoform X2 [Hermetia illucens]